MKIHSAEIIERRASSQPICQVNVEDDDAGVFADVIGWRDTDGSWQHERTDVTKVVLTGRWATREDIEGEWRVRGEVWNDAIAAECEAAWREYCEQRDEAAAERRIG